MIGRHVAADARPKTASALCREFGVTLRDLAPIEVERSEAHAAEFLLGVLRRSRWLRWRFPRALSDGAEGAFARWVERRGAQKFNLSAPAQKKIRGVFRRPPGRRIYDIYLHDRALQNLYQWGLIPPGHRYFLDWLTNHGRADQQVRDHEILWFLHESSEDVSRGVGLTYLVQPEWQEQFPAALTREGWGAFRDWVQAQHRDFDFGKSLRKLPPLLPRQDQHYLARSSGAGQTPSVAHAEGANILSHFCYPSGIQQAAVWTKSALEAAGVRTSCRDVPAGVKTTLLERVDWLGLEVYPFTIITVAPTPYFADVYERSGLFRRRDVHRIAYWAWELETIPEEWLQLMPLFDEIWSPTEFVATAMRTRMTKPIFTMPPGVEVGPIEPVTRQSLGIPDDHCLFLFMFDMYSEFERKNPLAVIRAFREAFGRDEKASLVVKTSRGHGDPAGLERLKTAAQQAGVVLIDEVVSRGKAYGFLAMCDCFVSLHRSEGFGLGIAEAMLLGKPVIATRYSGNLAYMHAGNSMLVDYHLIDILKSGPVYAQGNFWAEPSGEHAASFMRHVFEHRDAARALGARAQAELRESLSLNAAGERMRSRLGEISRSREV